MKFKFITILCLAFALLLSACGKSDADLQKAAETAAKAKAPTVTVAVKDGVATLTGEVATQQAKDDAATAAKVDGVKSVTNNITVKAPTPPPMTATTDTSMKPAMEAALKAKGYTDVTVDTSTTPATIRGTVAKGKLADVVQTAQTANGGKPVKNEVTEK